MNLKRVVLTNALVLITVISFCQGNFTDSVTVSLARADSLFLIQNLNLLAERCNVNAAKAQILQAKLFRNFNLSMDQAVYNTEYRTNGGRKWFDYSDKGETDVEIQKLFLLAGKRNKQIKIAQSGAEREEQLYFDLLRTLKYSLHSQFYSIFFLRKIIAMYGSEVNRLTMMVRAYESSIGKGNISRKEYLRIRALLFSLENEKLGYINQMIDAQVEINTLLHTSNLYYIPSGVPVGSEKLSMPLNLQALIDTAYLYRYDLKVAKTDLKISDLNLSYQKSLAIPDLTLSGGWDRNGSYIHNYNYAGLQFDLPLFNRNQGNIKAARFNLENSKYQLLTAEDRVKADVIAAFAGLVEIERLASDYDYKFLTELEKMNEEMFKNFEKRNISLIEFLDYYDAYKTNVIQLNTLMMNLAGAFEKLFYSVGKDILPK